MTATRLLIYGTDPISGETVRNIAHFHGLNSVYTTDPDQFRDKLDMWEPEHVAIDLLQKNPDFDLVIELLQQRKFEGSLLLIGNGNRAEFTACIEAIKRAGIKYLGHLEDNFTSKEFRNLMSMEKHPLDNTNKTKKLPLSAAHLRKVLENNELQIVFQPKVKVENGKIRGFEVLSRWEHKEFGVVPPSVFIGMAEQRKLINELTLQVFRKALPEFAQILHNPALHGGIEDIEDLNLSVNISAQALDDAQLQQEIGTLCDQYSVSRSRIVLELTETRAMEDARASEILLERLVRAGFQLAVDDFGSGYTTMLQLSRMPFSEVKVEKSFVMNASRSRESELATKAVIELARSLGLKATAAGVENEEALEMLKRFQCHYCQGYFIAPPMDAKELAFWLEQQG